MKYLTSASCSLLIPAAEYQCATLLPDTDWIIEPPVYIERPRGAVTPFIIHHINIDATYFYLHGISISIDSLSMGARIHIYIQLVWRLSSVITSIKSRVTNCCYLYHILKFYICKKNYFCDYDRDIKFIYLSHG